jgi:hypothetical protein
MPLRLPGKQLAVVDSMRRRLRPADSVFTISACDSEATHRRAISYGLSIRYPYQGWECALTARQMRAECRPTASFACGLGRCLCITRADSPFARASGHLAGNSPSPRFWRALSDLRQTGSVTARSDATKVRRNCIPLRSRSQNRIPTAMPCGFTSRSVDFNPRV